MGVTITTSCARNFLGIFWSLLEGVLLANGGQRRIFFWLNLTLLLRGLLRSTRHAKKRRTLPRLTLESLVFQLETRRLQKFRVELEE